MVSDMQPVHKKNGVLEVKRLSVEAVLRKIASKILPIQTTESANEKRRAPSPSPSHNEHLHISQAWELACVDKTVFGMHLSFLLLVG